MHTVEAALSQSYRDWIAVSLVYFHNSLSNLIALGEPVVSLDNPLNAPTFFNRSSNLVVQGLEAELTIVPMDQLTLKGTGTYFLGSGEELQVPPFFASAIANYRIGRFNINANAVYRQRIAALPTQKAYVLLNAAVAVQVVNKLQAQFIAQNLLDVRYRTLTAVLPDGVPNRGQAFFLGLSYTL